MSENTELDLDALEKKARGEITDPEVVLELIRRLRAAEVLVAARVKEISADAAVIGLVGDFTQEQVEVCREFHDAIRAQVNPRALVVCVRTPSDIQSLDEETMRAAGWVRAPGGQPNIITDAGLAALQSSAPDGVTVKRGGERMSIIIRGYALNQRQLDAITPVMNDLMHGKVRQRKFEQACVDALEKADCPLGYDQKLDPAEPLLHRAQNWIINGHVGMSSKAIWAHMMGVDDEDGFSYPYDPGDLNRCLLLLELIPEWKPRMPEMAQRGKRWARLAARWDEIAACFLDEAGLDWSKAKRAPKTYALMKEVLGD